jgi:hypothetical protein
MKSFKFLIPFIVLMTSGSVLAQYTGHVSRIQFVNESDTGFECNNGLIYDDNTFESGVGLNGTEVIMVQRFRPHVYPYRIDQMCFALTRSSAHLPDWPFDIVVYDTTGAQDSPGNLITVIPNRIAYGVPIYPNYAFFDFNGITGIPDIESGSLYIGMRWHPSDSTGSIGVDRSGHTISWYVFFKTNTGVWTPLSSVMSDAKSIGFRANGSRAPLVHDFAAGPFWHLPSEYEPGNTYDIKAFISNLGTSNETGAPIQFFVDGILQSTAMLNLNSHMFDSVSFQWTALDGNHTFAVVSALPGDEFRRNDTVRIVVLGGVANGGSFSGCRRKLHVKIIDNTSVYDSIPVNVPGWSFGIRDVNVTIDTVVHGWDDDLVFTLIHGSDSVDFISHVGGNGNNFIGTMLNDSALYGIQYGQPPFTGTFQPSNPLSAFNGLSADPNGYWTLKITDTRTGETGYLQAWCLDISYFTYIGGIGTITVPNYYSLEQNYPNPFNPSTKIKYTIPRAGDVKITVYDILGKEVAVLVNEYKNPGIYSIDFNASALSSGVYFYKIRAGDFTDTKKMLLIK